MATRSAMRSPMPCSGPPRRETSAATFRIPTRAGRTPTASRCSGRLSPSRREAGYAVVNVDAVVIADAPRLAPHADAIRARLAEALGIETRRRERQGQDERRDGRNGTRRRHRRPRRCIAYRALMARCLHGSMSQMRVRFAPARPGTCTWATRARHCSTGCSREDPAGRSSSASRTRTPSARRARRSRPSSTTCAGWGSPGMRAPTSAGAIGRTGSPSVSPPTLSTPHGCSRAAPRTTASAHRRIWMRSGLSRSPRDCSRSMRARAARSIPAASSRRVAAGEPAALRFIVPAGREITFADAVRGRRDVRNQASSVIPCWCDRMGIRPTTSRSSWMTR